MLINKERLMFVLLDHTPYIGGGFFMSKKLDDAQLEEQMKHILKVIQYKPINCTNHIMNREKCKNCVYNIGICCDMQLKLTMD